MRLFGFFFFSFSSFLEGYKRSSTQYQEVASTCIGITIVTISRSPSRAGRQTGGRAGERVSPMPELTPVLRGALEAEA